jgi:hypothetical protein
MAICARTVIDLEKVDELRGAKTYSPSLALSFELRSGQ